MNSRTRTASAERSAGTLERALTPGQMAMIAMGSALGTGLFLGAGAAIGVAGPGVIVTFAIGSLIAACIAACMGEMASRHPVRGGFGTLASHFLHPFWGYLARWCYWFVTVAVTGSELVAVATYLTFWWPQFPLWLGIALFAALILTLNLISVKSFGIVEFALSSIKVIAVAAFIVIGFLLIFFGLPGQSPAGVGNLVADGGFLPGGATAVWIALSIVMFSFGGIELISVAAAEARNPGPSVRTAAKTIMIRLAFFYVVAVAIIVCLVPWRTAAGGEDVTHSPFVMVFDLIGIPAAGVTNFIVLIAALSAANANLYAGGRLLHALSAERMAPAPLARTSRGQVPVAATLASTGGIAAAAAMAASGVGNVFLIMISIVTFVVLVVWGLILVTYIAYWRRREQAAPFTVPGGPVVAATGLVGIAAVFATVAVVPDMQLAAAVGLPFIAVLSLAYWLGVRHRIDPAETARALAEAEQA
ncbi:amino acid permease [Sediminivirga luteola]|uniref:Gamma-aminobutyrate permease n=1 Tax=Sediminivirga luteola TaxID=1774748 RepID=A0A8J2TZJ5_9MICO|nr:amino acid permease [Sediminivirga luteola]GGA20558.1 gamma-aminobutyrate permease [Sediminivirga luteola]